MQKNWTLMFSSEIGRAHTVEDMCGVSTHSPEDFHMLGRKWYTWMHVDSLEGTSYFCYISALAETSLSKDPFFMLELAVHNKAVGGNSYFYYNTLIWTILVEIIVIFPFVDGE